LPDAAIGSLPCQQNYRRRSPIHRKAFHF
jgi:hypothetical protein